MSQPALPAPERFVALLHSLAWAVAKQTGWGLSLQLIRLINDRIRRVKHRFARLAARIAAGTYKPGKPAASPRQTSETAEKKPPPRNPLPNTPGWLLPLEKSARGYRGAIEVLFLEPEMVALMSAAPEAMEKVLRPLCRMLALDMPPVLAAARAARRRAGTRPARPRKPRLRPQAPPPPPPAPPPRSNRTQLVLELVNGRPRLVWT